ncbi:hypothetical protein ISN44_As11g026080 [Arabidopsis suecica]|uniref:Uncharacterized protein n=1 Tax=Arabidopsis suecica TaxID=45249 RepID=A0A8T1ZDD7_ARASU|nr:hypothetical protein ISN44_As11g026080 [Arabidopsis suecica]
MPGNHSEISLNEQNRVDNDTNTKTTRKKKKKKDVTIVDDDDNQIDSTNQLVTKSKNRFIAKFRKKPKSPKGSRKGGCFRVMMRPRRRERDGDDDDDGSAVSSPVSDPNDERFSHEMMRVMLETNDFCSDECNPHR